MKEYLFRIFTEVPVQYHMPILVMATVVLLINTLQTLYRGFKLLRWASEKISQATIWTGKKIYAGMSRSIKVFLAFFSRIDDWIKEQNRIAEDMHKQMLEDITRRYEREMDLRFGNQETHRDHGLDTRGIYATGISTEHDYTCFFYMLKKSMPTYYWLQSGANRTMVDQISNLYRQRLGDIENIKRLVEILEEHDIKPPKSNDVINNLRHYHSSTNMESPA